MYMYMYTYMHMYMYIYIYSSKPCGSCRPPWSTCIRADHLSMMWIGSCGGSMQARCWYARLLPLRPHTATSFIIYWEPRIIQYAACIAWMFGFEHNAGMLMMTVVIFMVIHMIIMFLIWTGSSVGDNWHSEQVGFHGWMTTIRRTTFIATNTTSLLSVIMHCLLFIPHVLLDDFDTVLFFQYTMVMMTMLSVSLQTII